MATELGLDSAVRDACAAIRQRVKKKRQKNPLNKHSIRDYPAMVVACSYKKSYRIEIGESGKVDKNSYGGNPILGKALSAAGKIGSLHNGNIVGACAEPHAADKVMSVPPGCGINDLQFSKAYRPRTFQTKRYCSNCKKTFGI